MFFSCSWVLLLLCVLFAVISLWCGMTILKHKEQLFQNSSLLGLQHDGPLSPPGSLQAMHRYSGLCSVAGAPTIHKVDKRVFSFQECLNIVSF